MSLHNIVAPHFYTPIILQWTQTSQKHQKVSR